VKVTGYQQNQAEQQNQELDTRNCMRRWEGLNAPGQNTVLTIGTAKPM
jgi:hypothetical protein